MPNTKIKDSEVVSSSVETTEKIVHKTESKKAMKLNDDTLIKCKSTCSHLLFKGKDGSKVYWDNVGDSQDLTVRELREIKATQQKFFEDQWFIILGASETEDVEATAEDIYKGLGISRYFESIVDISKINEIVKWNESEIEEKVKMMSTGAQENLLAALNTAIRNGTLDSLRKIRAFEEALGCELVQI